jgi:hypothetical protein
MPCGRRGEVPARAFTLLLALATAVPPALAAARPPPEPVVVARGSPATLPDLTAVPRDQLVAFAVYTVSRGQLKLSAQLYPLRRGESREVTLELLERGNWRRVATASVDDEASQAVFRLTSWDASRAVRYRVRHAGGGSFEGTVRADPRDRDEFVLAALNCNSNADRSPPRDIVSNLLFQDPDLVAFLGDQTYDHDDALAGWISFGLQFRELLRDRPVVTIPDDHDVGQGNLWGSGGREARRPGGVDGGYLKPPSYVNLVQRLQTSHLPDPVDPAPVARGIGVYYTSLEFGGIGFAILEDRKWKTAPGELLRDAGPRPDLVTDPAFDPQAVDVPEASLLGPRQLGFLRQWGQDWAGTEMKVVLSQSPFAGIPQLHGAADRRLVADLDSNGWPQRGRNAAVEEIRRFFGLHIAGDQHLATVVQYGVNAWEDAGYAYAAPPILNYFPRWWWPEQVPAEPPWGRVLPLDGRAFDGLGNRITMRAYWNPTAANHAGAGYALVRLRKRSRTAVLECWPRQVDVRDASARQCEGWPVEVSQLDNYSREPVAWLPPVEVEGASFPVLRLFDDSDGTLVYSLRMPGPRFQPPVFRRGAYSIELEDGARRRRLAGVESRDSRDQPALRVDLQRD